MEVTIRNVVAELARQNLGRVTPACAGAATTGVEAKASLATTKAKQALPLQKESNLWGDMI